MIEKPEEASPDTLVLDGELLQFVVEPVRGSSNVRVVTAIHVHLTASSRNGLRAERDFASTGVVYPGDLRDKAGYQQSVRLAAHRIVYEIVRDVLRLADRYPKVG